MRAGKRSPHRAFPHVVLFCAMTLAGGFAHAQQEHRCAKSALAQAPKLLEFHFGPDNRIEIRNAVKVLAPMRNPANAKQTFDVLEVWGFIYKGSYRMRFIYARMPGDCMLMGQEIMEHASL